MTNNSFADSKIILATKNNLQQRLIYNARTFNDLERLLTIDYPNKHQINIS